LEAALKMKPGSIYAAFSSKENLYLLSLARYFETGRARFRAQIAAAPSPLAGLAGHLRIYPALPQSHIARQACMLSKTLIDTGSTDPEIAAQSKAYLAGMREEFETVFRAAQKAGEIPATRDPARLARRYQANITALRFELHQGSPPAEIAALAEDMA
ncbi:MAG: TetR/AcrR family transcriptional regulator C-terminal ligand-binding domain-containing protein, partial [Mangrovicoccus sp.]|nr:TetR/AcrR family transcriptional regulator C-terminal ligand-binding domain-containing protein [Mangrovicoccus sp.]